MAEPGLEPAAPAQNALKHHRLSHATGGAPGVMVVALEVALEVGRRGPIEEILSV